ncbi:putative epoxide hydrolase [Xylariomycetidae sp. FL2044]|nr:putative epoxide hydrolase [Xylariomycetidae sp. FL2044]
MSNPITSHKVIYAGGQKTIHYLAAGPVNGPMIIFLHGYPATAITWKPQIEGFAATGFRVVAPDLPGSGKSTSRRIPDDYCQEALVDGMMALLRATGRDGAIWVGHNWGSGVASAVATRHPEAVKALINICVPFATLERGWGQLIPYVNRDIYPADEYEVGQWDYHRYYEESFDEAVAWFESDIAGVISAVASAAAPGVVGSRKERDHSAARRDGGLFGGRARPWTVEQTAETPKTVAPDVLAAWIADMQASGLYGGAAFYVHHARNAAYLGPGSPGYRLARPALFVHAAHDLLCDTKTSRLVEPMRQLCDNLTEITIDAGHWVNFTKPAELQAGIFRFILDEVPEQWPGYWDSGFTKGS